MDFLNIQQCKKRAAADFQDDLIYKEKIIPLLNLDPSIDALEEVENETYMQLYVRKRVEISDSIYYDSSDASCHKADILFMIHDIYFKFISMLYNSFVVNSQSCCWKALIFNLPAYCKFHLMFGDSSQSNKDFVEGRVDEENVVAQEPTIIRFGIFDQKELETRGLASSEVDASKHSSMFALISIYI